MLCAIFAAAAVIRFRSIGRDRVDVRFDGQTFDRRAIVGLPAARKFDVARAWFGDLWQKRCAEAPGMIFDKMGHAPGDTVRRVLRNLESGQSVTVDRAP